MLEFVPNTVSSWLGFSGEAASFVHTLVLFALVPAVLFSIPGLTGRRTNRIPLGESVRMFAVMFLPVVALSHLVKALIRITSRLPYYPGAFHDPIGYTTARLIASGDMVPATASSSILFPWVSWVAVFALVAALGSAWWIGLKSPAFRPLGIAGRLPYLASVTLYACAIIFITVAARF